jgi:hypothetical protein
MNPIQLYAVASALSVLGERRSLPRIGKPAHCRLLAHHLGPYFVAKMNASASSTGHLNLAIVE